MASLQAIKKGESFSFVFDRNGDEVSGWTCTIEVLQFPGDTPAISRAIEADGLEWSGFLTSTETTALSKLGSWMVIAIINNAADDKTEYQTVRLHLTEAV